MRSSAGRSGSTAASACSASAIEYPSSTSASLATTCGARPGDEDGSTGPIAFTVGSLLGLMAATLGGWVDQVFGRMFEQDEWKTNVERNYWDNAALTSREAAKYLDATYAELKRTLGELGMVK